MTKASKGPCATVTPSDNGAVKLAFPIGTANQKEKQRRTRKKQAPLRLSIHLDSCGPEFSAELGFETFH
jgi:hypothetical protein